MEQRSFIRSFAVLLLTLGMLWAYPWVHRHVPWLQAHFRTYDPLSWIWTANAAPQPAPIADVPAPIPDAALDTVPSDSLTGMSAVLPREAFSRSHTFYDGKTHLLAFLKALHSSRQQIRIAYFGDSSVEGDLISQTLRDSLQQRFGGEGVGFVPILPAVQNFRRSVRQSASNNWYHFKPGRRNYKGLAPGLNGAYFTAMNNWEFKAANPDDAPAGDSLQKPVVFDSRHWVTYNASTLFEGTQRFPHIRLFYGHPGNLPEGDTTLIGKVTLKIANQQKQLDLTAPDRINALELPATNTTQLRLEFSIPNNLPVYGVSMESPGGVILDNYSMRGNSGASLLDIPEAQLRAFQELLDYELIILQFGLNVLNPKLQDYSWYEEQMVRTIAHFRQAMPEACILVVGLPDKSIRIDGVMRSDPSVARITEALRRASFRCGVAFFSLYEAMGGEGSMVDWVEKRRLANRDYTHFNFEGADRASNLLLQFLMEGFARQVAQHTDRDT